MSEYNFARTAASGSAFSGTNSGGSHGSPGGGAAVTNDRALYNELGRLQHLVGELNTDLAEAKKNESAAVDLADRMTAEVRRATASAVLVNEELAERDSRLASAQETRLQLEQKLRRSEEAATDLRERLLQAESRVSQGGNVGHMLEAALQEANARAHAAEEACQAHTNTIGALQQDIQALSVRNRAQAESLLRLESELEAATDRIKRGLSTWREAHDAKVVAEQALLLSEERAADDKRRAESRASQLQAQLQESQTTISELQQKLNIEKQTTNRLRLENQAYERPIEDTRSLRDLEAQVAGAAARVAREIERVQQSEEACEKAEVRAQRLEEDVDRLTSRERSVNEQLSVVRQHLQINGDHSDDAESVKVLTNALQQHADTLRAALNKASQLTAANDELQAELDRVQEDGAVDVASLRTELADTVQVVQSLRAALSTNGGELEVSRRTIASLNAEVSRLEQQTSENIQRALNEQSRSMLEQQSRNMEDLACRLEESRTSEAVELRGTIEKLRAEIAQREGEQSASHTTEVAELRGTIEKLKAEIAQREGEQSASHTTEIAELRGTIENLKAEIAQREGEQSASHTTEVAELRRTIEKLKAEIAQRESEMYAIQQRNDDNEARGLADMSQHGVTMDVWRQSNDQLRHALKQARVDHERVDSERGDAVARLAQVSLERDAAVVENKRLIEEKAHGDEERQFLQTRVIELTTGLPPFVSPPTMGSTSKQTTSSPTNNGGRGGDLNDGAAADTFSPTPPAPPPRTGDESYLSQFSDSYISAVGGNGANGANGANVGGDISLSLDASCVFSSTPPLPPPFIPDSTSPVLVNKGATVDGQSKSGSGQDTRGALSPSQHPHLLQQRIMALEAQLRTDSLAHQQAVVGWKTRVAELEKALRTPRHSDDNNNGDDHASRMNEMQDRVDNLQRQLAEERATMTSLNARLTQLATANDEMQLAARAKEQRQKELESELSQAVSDWTNTQAQRNEEWDKWDAERRAWEMERQQVVTDRSHLLEEQDKERSEWARVRQQLQSETRGAMEQLSQTQEQLSRTQEELVETKQRLESQSVDTGSFRSHLQTLQQQLSISEAALLVERQRNDSQENQIVDTLRGANEALQAQLEQANATLGEERAVNQLMQDRLLQELSALEGLDSQQQQLADGNALRVNQLQSSLDECEQKLRAAKSSFQEESERCRLLEQQHAEAQNMLSLAKKGELSCTKCEELQSQLVAASTSLDAESRSAAEVKAAHDRLQFRLQMLQEEAESKQQAADHEIQSLRLRIQQSEQQLVQHRQQQQQQLVSHNSQSGPVYPLPTLPNSNDGNDGNDGNDTIPSIFGGPITSSRSSQRSLSPRPSEDIIESHQTMEVTRLRQDIDSLQQQNRQLANDLKVLQPHPTAVASPQSMRSSSGLMVGSPTSITDPSEVKGMRMQLEEQENMIMLLRHDLKFAWEQARDFEKQSETASASAKALELSASEKDVVVAAVEAKMKQLQQAVEQKDRENQSKQQQVDAALDVQQSLESEIVSLQKQIGSMEQEKDALCQKMEQLEEKVRDEAEVEAACSRLRDVLTKERATATVQQKLLSDQLQAARATAAAATTAKQDEHLSSGEQLSSLEEQVKTLMAEHVGVAEELSSAKSSIVELESRIMELQKEVDLREATIKGLEIEVRGMNATTDVLHREAKDQKSESEGLKAQNVTLRNDLNVAVKRGERLDAMLASANASIERMKVEGANGAQGVQSMEAEVSQLQAENSTLREKLVQLTSAAVTESEEKERAEKLAAELQSELDEKKVMSERRKSRGETVKVQLASTSSELEATKTQLASTSSELEATKTQLASTSSELEAATGALAKAASELEATKTQLASTSSELEATKTQLASTAAELEAATKDLDSAVEHATASSQRADSLEQLLQVMGAQADDLLNVSTKSRNKARLGKPHVVDPVVVPVAVCEVGKHQPTNGA